jgi:Sec-independent protein translocase protein TatA
MGEGFKELKRGLREAEEEEKTARDESVNKKKTGARKTGTASKRAKKTTAKNRA